MDFMKALGLGLLTLSLIGILVGGIIFLVISFTLGPFIFLGGIFLFIAWGLGTHLLNSMRGN